MFIPPFHMFRVVAEIVKASGPFWKRNEDKSCLPLPIPPACRKAFHQHSLLPLDGAPREEFRLGMAPGRRLEHEFDAQAEGSGNGTPSPAQLQRIARHFACRKEVPK